MRLGHGINGTSTAHWPQGCAIVRLWDSGVRWSLISSARGKYNWATLDAYLAQAKQSKTQLIYCVGDTPQWAIGKQVPPYAGAFSQWSSYLPDLGMLAEFVTALVTHCQRTDGSNGLLAVEAWNEWNAGNFLDPHASASQVAAIGQTVWQATKAVNAAVLVTTPTPCRNVTTISQAMDSILAVGAVAYADAITFHGYVANGAAPSTIGPELDRMRAVMAKHGVNLPMWETESGWGANSNVAAANQPAYVKEWLDIRAAKGLDAAIWYQRDNQTHGTLWTPSGGDTPAGKAYMSWQSPVPAIAGLPAVTDLARVA